MPSAIVLIRNFGQVIRAFLASGGLCYRHRLPKPYLRYQVAQIVPGLGMLTGRSEQKRYQRKPAGIMCRGEYMCLPRAPRLESAWGFVAGRSPFAPVPGMVTSLPQSAQIVCRVITGLT